MYLNQQSKQHSPFSGVHPNSSNWRGVLSPLSPRLNLPPNATGTHVRSPPQHHGVLPAQQHPDASSTITALLPLPPGSPTPEHLTTSHHRFPTVQPQAHASSA
ncbi:uncharacterized protein BDZ99DRAFT_467369 [Mytilinidion resinicola]|uniref:Uncharacterized protein n=1 Tax=Mytilinidion resinicola TaxID=574789 RepID=A0A6A6Y810_9PEZI|nr:uncharacterized protein BDZ99DRAFT_467369 [Mytilinidion resinicola]KAF2804683.1 hypothetical protein BDZ99DRAFT_467369 [Mytilinidion resinicola]